MICSGSGSATGLTTGVESSVVSCAGSITCISSDEDVFFIGIDSVASLMYFESSFVISVFVTASAVTGEEEFVPVF